MTGVDTGANTLQKFSISGTDLGIMWDNGDSAGRQVLMAFGDTYGYCGMRSQQWRYNTLLRTQDKSLSRGLAVGASFPRPPSPSDVRST
ncbi:conserved secreted protein [Mycobacteroides abscessus subsp. massiliense]|nr:conserved secreted protein [Mycobacteroides abscessus subsp. massiliense]